jgi:DNA polymerase-4
VCRRTRRHRLLGQTVSVGCRGADFHFPTGFHRQMKMPEATNQTMDLFAYAWKLFLRFWDEQPIRSIGVSLSGLKPDDTVQLNLFKDREKQMKLGYVMDEIKQRFGPTAILRAVSLTSAGQAHDRAQKIGGHYE